MQQKLKLETTHVPSSGPSSCVAKSAAPRPAAAARAHTHLLHTEVLASSAPPGSASTASVTGRKAVSRLNASHTGNCHFSFGLKKILVHKSKIDCFLAVKNIEHRSFIASGMEDF